MVLWKVGRCLRWCHEWSPHWVLNGWQHGEGLATVAPKSPPVALYDSGWAWRQQRYCVEDCHWKCEEKKSVLVVCTTRLTAEQKEDQVAACQNLIEVAHSNGDFFKKYCNWQRILVLGLLPSDETTIICMGWRKYATATESSIPQISSEDHVGDFLLLAGSHAQRICTRRTDC